MSSGGNRNNAAHRHVEKQAGATSVIEPYERLAAVAAHHIAKGQQRVRKQLELLIYLETAGHSREAAVASRLLDTMQISMATLRTLRDGFNSKGSGVSSAADDGERRLIAAAQETRPRRRIRPRARSRRRMTVSFRPPAR
jgi:hypothetical protein